MLYTTYFAKMNEIPEDCIKLIVTRYPPKWLDISEHKNTIIEKHLSPFPPILAKYKTTGNWDEYVAEFTDQMDMVVTWNALKRVENMLKVGRDVCLICYEKDYTRCHRSILGRYFQGLGFEWREL